METAQYITDLGEYLNKITEEGRLNLGEKNTTDYDKLFEEIYNFTMDTVRKDGGVPGDRAQALTIACDNLIKKIKSDQNEDNPL